MSNLEKLSGNDPLTADGMVGCSYEDANHMRALITPNSSFGFPKMNCFKRVMKFHFYGTNCQFSVGYSVTPFSYQCYILLVTHTYKFEEELSWLLKCLQQTRIMTNPIVCDLT